MAKETFIAQGLVDKLEVSTGKFFGKFNLNRWFKETAKRYGIQFYDACCPTASAAGFPVRLKADKTGIEFLDVDGAWKDVTTP